MGRQEPSEPSTPRAEDDEMVSICKTTRIGGSDGKVIDRERG